MTTTLTSPQVAILTAKLARMSIVDRQEAGEAELSDALDALVSGGYAEKEATFGGHRFSLTETGRAAAAQGHVADAVRESPNSPESRAKAALWYWLLINGYLPGYHGHRAYYGPIGHLLLCGLDLNRSAAVDDDEWETWAGTFTSPARNVGVSGRATCRCGQISGLTIFAEVESIVALLSETLSIN